MTQSPLISVLVTVYNREAYLPECLESILASTWQDFEIVIVDDGSSDASPRIAEDFAGRDSRVRYHRNTNNLGDYPNRMRAAQLATGDYMKYVDSDDIIYRHSLAIMAEAMSSHPDAGIGLSHSAPEDEHPYPWRLEPLHAWRKQFLGAGCLACGPSGAIIHRQRFLEVGGFGAWGVLNDIDLWYRMSARWPVVLLQPGLVWWRKHDDQEFRKSEAFEQYLEAGYRLDCESLCRADNPLSAEETRVAQDRVRQHHARKLLSLTLKDRRPLDGWRLLRQSGLGPMDVLAGLRPYR